MEYQYRHCNTNQWDEETANRRKKDGGTEYTRRVWEQAVEPNPGELKTTMRNQ
jgi:hypothetical protein